MRSKGVGEWGGKENGEREIYHPTVHSRVDRLWPESGPGHGRKLRGGGNITMMPASCASKVNPSGLNDLVVCI